MPDTKDIIRAKLAEWAIELTDGEVEQLVTAYDKLLLWQETLEEMADWQEMTGGAAKPVSEPALVYLLGREVEPWSTGGN